MSANLNRRTQRGRIIPTLLLTFLIGISVPAGTRSDEKGQPEQRHRARDMQVAPGPFQPGKENAITDVPGVRVGQVTRIEGSDIRTGLTVIIPPGENVFRQKLPAAVFVGNAFGKLVGSTQVDELGQLETPILLTNTLSVWRAAEALTDYMLSLPGNEDVRSINPVVGETNDGYLNDIRNKGITRSDVLNALQSARSGPVQEGSVGAGTGTVAFGWKGGIGTSSRVVSLRERKFILGVLVQTNFGGRLTIDGVPIWKTLPPERARNSRQNRTPVSPPSRAASSADGSCMIIVATDAPADARQLKRLAKRALAGMARAGSTFSNGSGDYVIAFSTTPNSTTTPSLSEDDLSPLFEGVADATEEAIYNSLFMATTITGFQGHVVKALPLDEVARILQKYGRGPSVHNSH